MPGSVICKKCKAQGKCTECNQGFRLGIVGTPNEGKCLSCSDANCLECDTQVGVCRICKPGFYLKDSECSPCNGNCLECDNADTCTKCDENKAVLDLSTGECLCKTEENYIADSDGICKCNSDYITVDGKCKSCSQVIPDCYQCAGQGSQSSD